MTVKELSEKCGFEPICLPDGERTVSGVYIGDLLSWVMGRAKADDAWITIRSNVNVLAVASLSDVACVILAEGTQNARPCSKLCRRHCFVHGLAANAQRTRCGPISRSRDRLRVKALDDRIHKGHAHADQIWLNSHVIS